MKADSPLKNEQLETLKGLLPKRMELQYLPEENVLLLTVNGPSDSIQSESCAFEGWVLLLHERALSRRIVLDAPASADEPQSGQFLYRAYQFSLLIYDWFSLSAGLGAQVAAFMDRYRSQPKVYAFPGSPGAGDRGENILLSRFSGPDSVLYAMPECEGAKLQVKLPVDLYWQAGGDPVFPHSAGLCVDLWALREKTLNLFLLKYQSPKMSVLSELFYCASVLRDAFMQPEENHIGLDGRCPPERRREIKDINAWFLCDVYHPQFEPIYLCDMMTTKTVRFHSLTYSCELPEPSLQV